jgi:hypothetical protein
MRLSEVCDSILPVPCEILTPNVGVRRARSRASPARRGSPSMRAAYVPD